MKKIILVFIISFLSYTVFSSPFGLKMGMNLEEIREACEEEPSFVKDDIYLINPVKKHPLFIQYYAYVNEKTGLYQIRARSESIKCNDYGTEIQNSFNMVKDRIAKVYGKPKVINKVDSSLSEYIRSDQYWFYNFKHGAQQLSAVWGEKTNLPYNLSNIVSITSLLLL